MRCQIESKELAGLIDAARPFLPKATTMPVLEHFRLEAKGDRLYCTATDLKMGVKVSAPAEVPPGAEGEVLVPGKLFADLVRSFPAGVKVELETTANSCVVLCGKSRAELAVMDHDQYPTPPEEEKDALSFSVPADALKKALKQVLVVTGGDDLWNSVLFDFDGEKLHLVATDSHRLALYEGFAEVKGEPRQAVLLAEALEALAKILPDGQAADVLIGSSLAHFTCGDIRVFCVLLNRPFPQYRQVLPAETRAGLVADRRSLLDALERISLLVDTSRQVRYCVLSVNGSVTLDASSDTGNAHETLAAESEGEIKIAFNPSYLAKILRVIPEDRASLCFCDPLRPITVNSEKCLYLVLPVRAPEVQQQGGA